MSVQGTGPGTEGSGSGVGGGPGAPTTVVTAHRLVLATLLLSLVAPLVATVTAAARPVPPDILAHYRESSPGATEEAVRTTVVAGAATSLVLHLLFAVVVAVVAARFRRGRTWAQILTAVLLVAGALVWDVDPLGDALGWVVKIVMLVAAVAVAVLLFLGTSRAWFAELSSPTRFGGGTAPRARR